MSKKRPSHPALKTFKFKKHANIGAADAIEDKTFLEQCFVDTGELSILADKTRPECIILGRTGSGKTALLERLYAQEEKVIKIEPEGLALTYVSNNQVLKFFAEAGVKMDIFYRLLWRHIFAVELIKARYDITNEQKSKDALTRLRERILPNRAKNEVVDYLVDWGSSFWKETDYRVKEVTKKFEEELKKSLGGKLEGILGAFSGTLQFGADKAKLLTEEQKTEIVQHGEQVVQNVQIQKLSKVIDLLDSDVFDDRKKKYYITIDKLDEDWVDDNLRYYIIRALIEAVRDFNKISAVKIVVAIREDLMDRVFRYTRSSGYQEEKYSSMYLYLKWKRSEIEELLTLRINQLIQSTYTKSDVSLQDILPTTIRIGSNRQDTVEYILDRTMLRPRDAISFINECIKSSEGKPTISQTNLLDAESKYSEKRLRALADEWASDYPNLIES